MQFTTGKINTHTRVVIYGSEGIGKSTLASLLPNPVFMDIEQSTSTMDVTRTDRPKSWQAVLGMVREFKLDKQGFETLVIDTADALERLATAHILSVAQVDSIEDFGYGKGWVKVAEVWAKLLDELTELANSGMNVCLCSHAQMRKFEQPEEWGAYDRWELKLCKQVAAQTKEWSDLLLFCNYETLIVEDTKTKVKKAQGGRRVIHTVHHVVWDAKNRHGLPPVIEFTETGTFAAIAHCFPPIGGRTPAVTTPAVTTPAVITPAVITPAVTTPAVTTPAVTTPAVTTPANVELSIPPPQGTQHANLRQLMARQKVQDGELQIVVGNRGYFPKDTPVDNYPADFVAGCLVAKWDKVEAMVLDLRKLPY